MKNKIFISKEAKKALRNPKYRAKVIKSLEEGSSIAEAAQFTITRLKQGF